MATGVALKSLATGTEWDLSGDALSGRQMYVYARGTTTQVTVYQDAGLTTPYTQPVTTGADGVAGAVPGYVASGQSIDFVDVLTGNRSQANPLDASTTVIVGSAFTGTVLGGSGDNLNGWAATTTGQILHLLQGSAASPDTGLNPAVKTSRTIDLQNSAITGDGSEQATAGEGLSFGTAANQVQTVGWLGYAENAGTSGGGGSPDACGLYAVGRITGSGIGLPIGLFAEARTDTATSKAPTAIQCSVYNGTGSDETVNATGLSGSAFWSWASGANKVGAGLEFGNPFGTQFDVGVHFNGQVAGGKTGPTATADIQSDSNATTSLLIGGTHTTALAVKSGAGYVLIGGTTQQVSGDLLEVIASSSGDVRPALFIGNGSVAHNYSMEIRNGSGFAEYFVSGGTNNVLTGTATGDSGVRPSGSLTYHIGGTVSTIKVTAGNLLGFYNATAVAQQNGTGNTTTVAAGSTTSVFTNTTFSGGVGSTGYTIGDVVKAMKNYGLLAQ